MEMEEQYRARLPAFREATKMFYAGELTVKEYKGLSGGFGSYAQRGGEKGMVRLRLAGGSLDRAKLTYAAGLVRRYHVDLVHVTTCQALQLHDLPGDAIPIIIDEALDHGIVTFAGGGDYPRNVTASPLTGVASGAFDVLPYAKAAERFLLGVSLEVKLPRKLKVGFADAPANETHATLRDLGFVAKSNGKFDVYSGGGLGNNPKLGLLVAEDAEPADLLCYLDAMVQLFCVCGNYCDRGKARVRYMRDTLGDDGYVRNYRDELAKAFAKCLPKVSGAKVPVIKSGDGGHPHSGRAHMQVQSGLFYVVYHPLGGDPAPDRFCTLADLVATMPEAELRLSPDGTIFIINLTAAEADLVAEATADGARTQFEASVSCVGATICQIGVRDSHGLLLRLVDMERREGFADGILPLVHISGCVSSCGSHQIGTLGFRGAPSVEGKPAFQFSVNGSHLIGEERLGQSVGVMTDDNVVKFLAELGRTVAAAGTDYAAWYRADPAAIVQLAVPFLASAAPNANIHA